MNLYSVAFSQIYFSCALLAVLALLIRFSRPLTNGRQILSLTLLLPLIFIYLAGMHRTAGIDFDSYSAAYDGSGIQIPDVGYTGLTWITFRLGISFSTFLLLQGVFTLAALWVVAKAKDADSVVVIAIYLLHLAVVRDMSQSRIALAVALYLLGQTRERVASKVLLYLAAMSIHVTVAVLLLVWVFSNSSSRWRLSRQIIFAYLPLGALALWGSGLLSLLSFIVPRVDIYLSWDEVAYGAPLESFGALIRTVLVVAAYLAAMRRFKRLDLQPYLMTELAGAAILLGFSQFSIFAARLSNVAISMYPFGIGIIALAYQKLPLSQRRNLAGFAVKGTVFSILIVLVLRPGSLDVLLEIVPTILVTASGWD